MTLFSGAQLIFLDPAKVASAASVGLDRIDLYFQSKPQATNNKSGITNPGIQIYFTTTANSVPQLPDNLSTLRSSRVQWQDVQISNDASLATTFRFDPPVPFPTSSSIAFLISPDGEEDFVPWMNVTGDYLVGTSTVSTGTSKNSAIGPYYSFISAVPNSGANNTSNSNMITSAVASQTSTAPAANYIAGSWTPKVGTALKFNAYVARYAVQGNANLYNFTNNSTPSQAQIFTSVVTNTNSNGETTYVIPQERIEYLTYDRITSTISNIAAGERVFPILPEYPPGQATKVTLSCTSGSNTIVATGNVNFSNLFNTSTVQPIYIVIKSANHLGANADVVNLRQVTAVLSNTQIAIDTALTFSNSVATFWMAPVATVDQFKSARFFGNTQDVVICRRSTANTSAFFAPMSVNSISISSNGTGYSNTDWVRITGHSALSGKVLNAYNANANIITNGNGSITSILLNNVGSGFWNIANLSYTIANSSGSTSSGTGANLSITIGTNIKGEFLGFNGKGGNFANVIPRDLDIGRIIPALLASVPSGTYYNASIRFPYYSITDTSVPTGSQTYCDPDGGWDTLSIQTFNIHYPFEFMKRRTLPSWSNELFTPYANGTSSVGLGGTSNTVQQALTSNASVIQMTTVSNNDFNAVTTVPQGSKITFSRYIINNDYTNENTNYGNAWAKGIEVKFNMASNTLSEDLLVYATVYKPANTDVLCFAKIYNTQDNDAFDTKDWTMLEVRSGQNVVSSPTNTQDRFEITWGLPKYGNVAFRCTGSVTTTNGSKTLTGSNTNFSNLASGDLVLIQNNLFPNSYMISVVNVVTNATSMTISQPVSNLNLVGTGFIVSKLAYKYQAFTNYLNDNVARYYSSTMTENDGFNTAQLKFVMLSANGLIVPLIGDVRAVAVSA